MSDLQKTLTIGNVVLTNYPYAGGDFKKATIESVEFGAFSQSGILVKLKEYQEPLDLFWIFEAPNEE